MKIRLLVLVVLLAGGVAAYSLWPREKASDGLSLYGNVDIREVQLGFRVGGRLQAMKFEEGDTVPAGILLAKVMIPETETPVTGARHHAAVERSTVNIIASVKVKIRVFPLCVTMTTW